MTSPRSDRSRARDTRCTRPRRGGVDEHSRIVVARRYLVTLKHIRWLGRWAADVPSSQMARFLARQLEHLADDAALLRDDPDAVADAASCWPHLNPRVESHG